MRNFTLIMSIFISRVALAGFTQPFLEHATPEVHPKSQQTAIVSIPSIPTKPILKVAKRHFEIPHFDLHGADHAKVLAFAKNARAQKLPSRDYFLSVNGKIIAEKYAASLHPKNYGLKRTRLNITLDKIAKITQAPPPLPYEQIIRRIDALFAILNNQYAIGSASLWQLSNENEEQQTKAHDLLFAGIGAERSGWESLSMQLYLDATTQHLGLEDRYVGILWQELESFQEELNVDMVTRSLLSEKLGKIDWKTKIGDKANYHAARRSIELARDPNPWHNLIKSVALRSRLDLFNALALLEQNKFADAKIQLELLMKTAAPNLENEIHLALARIAVSQKDPQAALAEYHLVRLDGANRMDLLVEKAYAAYKAGIYQESLGKSLGLESPYFLYGFAPEAFLIEALSRKALCDYGGATQALDKLRTAYEPEQKFLNEWTIAKKPLNETYNELIGFHEEKTPLRSHRYLLALPSLKENQHLLNLRQKEWREIVALNQLKHLQAVPENWGFFLSSFAKKSAEIDDKLVKNIVLSAKAEAADLKLKIDSIFNQIELLKLDVATRASEEYNLQSAMNFPARKLANVPLPTEKILWPFRQEVWEDELDDLVAKNPSRCVDKKTAAR